jgi:hypothetical protein
MTTDSGHSRRTFLQVSSGTFLGSALMGSVEGETLPSGASKTVPLGPASKYVPTVCATFVRRRGEYGILWPGAIYDGEAALRQYRQQLEEAGRQLGVTVILRPLPIYSEQEASEWVAQSQKQKPDGLLVLLLDRQQHSWPSAYKAANSGIPTVVFAPVGTAFTTNTEPLAKKNGVFIASTDDFSQAVWGLKMLKAGAKLRETRLVVLKGTGRKEIELRYLGTKLRYVPAKQFLDEYNRTAVTDEIRHLTTHYLQHATRVAGPSEQDVINGVKSYVVARKFLEREEGDGITMDCLGALGPTQVSLPCIAWSRMLDDGVPAACEADIGAAVTHALVQYLFDRPGFQQDPVPETARECLVGAHCTCPTRLNGFGKPPVPYLLSYHHGKRDAVPVPTWPADQRMTVVILNPSDHDGLPPELIFSTGSVVENIAVPPSGGCVVSVMVKLDNVSNLLDYPGFHQLFLLGDHKKELRQYCQLFALRPSVV